MNIRRTLRQWSIPALRKRITAITVGAAVSAVSAFSLNAGFPATAHAQRQQQQQAGSSEAVLDPKDLKVTFVDVSPRKVRPGGVVRVSMNISNYGPLVARAHSPGPSFVYSQGDTFRERGFKSDDDRFSIVMTLSGPDGYEWPYRWGIGKDLPLGKSRKVSFPLRLTTPGIYRIFVGVAVGDRVFEVPSYHLTGIQVVAPGKPLSRNPEIIPPTPPVNLTVNGEKVAIDQRPVLRNAQVLVPIRFVMEEMGAAVQWHPGSRTVTARRGDYDMTLNVGEDTHTVNGKQASTMTNPFIVNGRTMVPLRFVTEGVGGTAFWDNRTRTVQITLPALNVASGR